MFLFLFRKILILNSISLRAALIERSNLDGSNLASELTVQLVQKCFLRDDRTVGLIGDVPETIVKKLHLSGIAATASVGDFRPRADERYRNIFHSKSLYRQLYWIRLQRTVHCFVVAASSQSLLRLALETAKTSVWWNSAGFFIVTNTLENENCGNAFSYLWTLWQMGILHSIFLCKDNDGSLVMYGYSPYYDGHSKSWGKVAVYDGRGGHPWALLKLKQVHDVNICETITFDKMKTLDGHPIPIGVLSIPPTLIVNKNGENWYEKHVGEDAMIVKTIWKSLNGTMKEIYYHGEDPIGFDGANETYTGFMADVSLGRVDHGMNGLYTNLHWRVKSAYPHAATGVHFLTRTRGNKPKWLKFATVYEIPVVMAIQTTIFIAIIFLRYIDHRPWSVAIMEVVRVIFSMSMSRFPSRVSSRIFWSMVFVMILVFSSTFQGLLISLLTIPTPYRNIDDIDDLIASGYTVHGYPPFKSFFDETKLSDKFYGSRGMNSCIYHAAKGHSIACVSEYMYLRSITMSNNSYHMSKQMGSPFYTAYLTKLDWPLFGRFDTLLQRLFNSGITRYWREFYLDEIVRKHWAEMRNTLPPNRKVLSVDDLTLILHIFCAGVVVSSITFVIEVILSRPRRALI